MTFKMNMKIFRIFSSWDFQQDEVAFSTKENAMEWLKNHPDIKDILKDCDCDDVEEMLSEELVEIEKIELDPPPLDNDDDDEEGFLIIEEGDDEEEEGDDEEINDYYADR